MAENIKTAPFDLEKAIKGHPLVTRNGYKVSSFFYFKELSGFNDYPCRAVCVAHDIILSCSEAGCCYSAEHFDLLLDLSIPWEKPLKIGDEIEVNNMFGRWIPAIFIKHGADGGVIAVDDDTVRYNSDRGFCAYWFKACRRKQSQDNNERQAAEQLVNDATAVMNELGTAIEKAKALLTK